MFNYTYDHNEELIDETEFAEELVDEPEEYQIGNVVDCEKLNIRQAPNAKAEVVKIVPKGTEVMIDIEQSTADFYSVCTETGVEGFCMKKFIKIQ